MFKIVSTLIYLGSIVALLVVGTLVSSVLGVYPASHIASFGPVVPAVSQAHAGWLPAAPFISWAIAAVSVVAGVLLWRAKQSGPPKLEIALLIGALNYFLALFFTTSLLVAYFYLPKVANAG